MGAIEVVQRGLAATACKDSFPKVAPIERISAAEGGRPGPYVDRFMQRCGGVVKRDSRRMDH